VQCASVRPPRTSPSPQQRSDARTAARYALASLWLMACDGHGRTALMGDHAPEVSKAIQARARVSGYARLPPREGVWPVGGRVTRPAGYPRGGGATSCLTRQLHLLTCTPEAYRLNFSIHQSGATI
jgi:hypothetical protein